MSARTTFAKLAAVALAAFISGLVCYHATLKFYEDPMLSVDLGLVGTGNLFSMIFA